MSGTQLRRWHALIALLPSRLSAIAIDIYQAAFIVDDQRIEIAYTAYGSPRNHSAPFIVVLDGGGPHEWRITPNNRNLDPADQHTADAVAAAVLDVAAARALARRGVVLPR